MRIEFTRADAIVFGMGGPSLPSQILVNFQIETVQTRLDEVSFRIERCLTPAFDNDDIAVIDSLPGVIGQTVYETLDITAKLINLWRRYFYRVVATGPDAEEVISRTFTWETAPKVYETEIISRNQLLLEFETGIPCFAFVQRTVSANPCDCFDPVTFRSKVSNCFKCLSTGKVPPYFQPIQLFADFNPAAQLVQIAQFGEIQPGQCDVWWGAYPLLKPRDILLEALSGKMWRIVNIRPIQPQRTTIQQIARLEQVNLRDTEYSRLKVDADLLRQLVSTFESNKQERRF